MPVDWHPSRVPVGEERVQGLIPPFESFPPQPVRVKQLAGGGDGGGGLVRGGSYEVLRR